VAPLPKATARAFREPIVPAEIAAPESPDVSFGDLVRMLGEGIADAQASLDRSSAELVVELSEQKVKLVPSITETIGEDGTVKYTTGDPQELSLLELGVTPTFYAFSQATVEVTLDVKIVETVTSSEQGKRFGLFAGTRDVRVERKLNRDVTMASKLTATLVPVPSPLRLEPVRTTNAPGA
jgi:hypothetical protein